MTDFKFTDGQITAITAPLRRSRFAAADIAEFIAVAALEIDDWLVDLPKIDGDALADGRRRMKQIEKHAAGLRHELASLPWGWREALLRELANHRDPAWPQIVQGPHIEIFLNGLLAAAGSQIDIGTNHNSRDTGRKVKLLKALAETFNGCFGRMPTKTPDGPFMEAVAAIADAIGEPLGKDAVASGIAAFRAEREFMFGPDET